jgi:hypothetical protein
MTEIFILSFFLFLAFALAPLVTNSFFINGSKIYSDSHKLAVIVLICGALLNLKHLILVWPLFCVFGFLLYLKNEYKCIVSAKGLATCIPFVFSLISSVWFVAGVFDLQLLGYSREWSFYAALHGSFIGWIFVGCLVFLSKRKNSSQIYLWGCYVSFLLFLFVAFGIDGVPYIKRIGVIGFSIITPFLIGHYALNLKKENKLSIAFATVSLFSIILSLALAVLNEFLPGFPKVAYGFPVMVITHGLMNACFAIPFFFFAIKTEENVPLRKKDLHGNVI